MKSEDWYEVIQQKDHLIIIRERLDKINTRYLTTYVNLYLIIGDNKALLIDTGCGLVPLKQIVEKYVDGKELIVVNSHSHFDHIGANSEFDEVFIHKSEEALVTKPTDINHLKDAQNPVVNGYNKINWLLSPAMKVIPLNGDETFDLGGIQVGCIHTPGHSPGSLSFYTNKNELFTADLAHYGAMFTPPKENLSFLIGSIEKLIEISIEQKIKEIYPSHEEYNVSLDLLDKLSNNLKNIESFWNSRKPNEENNAWEIEIGKFIFLVKVGRKERKEFKSALT